MLKWRNVIAVVLALMLALGAASFAEEAGEAGAPASGANAYLMFANADWSVQNWGVDSAEGVTVYPAEVDGDGQYSTALEFAAPSEGLAFAAIGIKNGEYDLPGAFIRVDAIRLNGEPVEFTKGYTSSDDGVETRMNLYNEWVSELPSDARSYDGSLEGASPMILDPTLFTAVTQVEVDFTVMSHGLDQAYLMYASGDWSAQNWGVESAEGVTVTAAEIADFGDYTVGLAFENEAEGLAFAALGIVNGEKTYPGAYLKINAIRVNGEEIAFAKGYTSSDEGVTTRMNIYNEWVDKVPDDARSYDGILEDASFMIVDTAAFAAVKSVEVDFSLLPVTDVAFLMYANGDWTAQNWGAESAEGVTVTAPVVNGAGTYTVGLEFAAPAEDLAFAAVGIQNGEKTFNGYFIDITEIKVNGDTIEVGKGYTSSDDGVTTRENIYNEWTGGVLPEDARRADGDLEGASAMIVDKAAFASVSSVEVTFNYIYGKPIVKSADAPLTEEEAAAMKEAGFNAYIGVQTTSYIFRNAWDEANYGRDAEDGLYFNRLTGWDADNKAVDYGGTFADAQITGDGEYTVSLTTGEMGFGSDETFRLLFVSTDIPVKLVEDGFLTISDVKIKGLSAATQEYTDVDTSGSYVRLVVIDEYNRSNDPFGYTVPGADSEISVAFTVSGW